MIRRTIDGIECVFYEQNLFHDNLVLIKYGNEQATTKQIKIHIDSIIGFISYLIEAGSIFDERLEKYAKALSVYKAIKAIFNRRKPGSLSIEAAKITIDVTKEIALMEIKDHSQRAAIKSAAFIVKFMIDCSDQR